MVMMTLAMAMTFTVATRMLTRHTTSTERGKVGFKRQDIATASTTIPKTGTPR